MLKSFRKIFIFLIPIFAILLLPTAIIIISREYYSIDDILQTQKNKPTALFNPCCNNLRRPYKAELINKKNPEIITLGTSRVLEFRKDFFIKPSSFINGGQVIVDTGDLVNFIEKLPHKNNLKLILLGLDHQMFTPGYKSNDIYTELPDGILQRFSNVLGKNWKRIYGYIFTGKVPLDLLERSQKTGNIGLISLANNSGFRADGSYEYGDSVLDFRRIPETKEDIRNTLKLLSSNRGAFLYGTTTSMEAVKNLEKFLHIAKERNIEVIGFMPSYPQEIYEEMTNKADDYSKQVLNLSKLLNDIFSSYSYSFFDFSDDTIINAKTEEYMGVFHSTDKLALRMLIHMSNDNPKVLNRYINSNNLQKVLESNAKGYLERLRIK